MQDKLNIAARMARWSSKNRKKAIFGWLAFVVLAFVIGNAMGSNVLDQSESGVGESGRAEKAYAAHIEEKAGEAVLVHSGKHKAGSPEFDAAVNDVVTRLEGAKGVKNITSDQSGAVNAVSPDKHSVLVNYELKGDAAAQADAVDAPVAAMKSADKAHSEFRIDTFGSASSEKEFMKSINQDLRKAEFISLPLTLLILLIAFGTFVAAGLPVLLALTFVLGTMGLLGPVSQLSPVSDSINSVVLLIGLAVGVDYAMFYIRRLREEREAGKGEEAALLAAASTSGRAVLISGFTVMTAMSGMYLAGAADFASYATGTIMVVALAMVGSTTVLPALLSKLGGGIDKGRVPLVGRVKAKMTSIGIWGRIVDKVLKRPLLSAVASTAVLVALAVPALGLNLANAGTEALPQDLEVVQTFNRVAEAFPSENSEATVVVEAKNVTAASVTAGIDRLEAATKGQKQLFTGDLDVEVSPDKELASIVVPTAGDGTDAKSDQAVDELRDNLVPQTLGQVDGVTANVGGDNASDRDFVDSMKSHLPLVFLFVLGSAFLLLMVTFRSIVIPIKAILLNLLSVGAAYGVLVSVFQNHWAEGLLDFNSSGAIAPWLPLFMFVILFGLSMDYHVFILTRIKEAYDSGMSTEEAVSSAIKSTAGVVTSAAVVMVGVFSIFATLSLLDFKQMGVGLAAAILIDATIIRGVLLPASMKLLGDWNWYLPKRLGWLPQVALESSPEPAVA